VGRGASGGLGERCGGLGELGSNFGLICENALLYNPPPFRLGWFRGLKPMRWLLAAFICYTAWVVQTTVAPHLALAGVTPRCLPMTLALLVWTQTPRGAVVWGMIAGMGFDLLGAGPPGVETGVSLALAATFGWWRRRGIWMMPQMLFPLGLGIAIESGAAAGSLMATDAGLQWPAWREVVTHATLSSTLWGGGFLALLAGLLPRRSAANSSG